jgi:2-succinyl-5-enolpyruvyl-6-hydroxy-3-cyclohexene-1-carboxylate synthase
MRLPYTENLSRLWTSIIIDELAKNGVENFYCAPGMRNAPIMAAAKVHVQSKTLSGFDERSLAYRALGYAKASGKTPAITCTSGTAVANFLPAVIEAYRSNIPLVVLSADRPVELVKTDANQTIDQTVVLKDFCVDTLFLEAPSTSLSANRLRALVKSVINKAITYKRPVHINIPLREPLGKSPVEIEENYLKEAVSTFTKNSKTEFFKKYDNFTMDPQLSDILASAKSPLLVIGKLESRINKEGLVQQVKKLDIPKFIDITSGIKYQFSLEDKLTPSFDHPEVYEAWKKSPPDLIIHIGERLVSKHYYRFQEENSYIQVVHVTDNLSDHDPGFSNNIKIMCSPLSFLQELTKKEIVGQSPISWNDFVKNKMDIIEDGPLSFAYISKTVVENGIDGTELLISNSTSIRSFDNFVSPDQRFHYHVYANRGVSGIEGFISTLTGLADSGSEPKTLVIGDISFKHDLNALFDLKEHANKNLNIILVNNNGGGIFNLLPIRDDKEYIELLTTPHENNFAGIIKTLPFLNYSKCETKSEFLEIFNQEKEKEHISFIEVSINPEENLEVFNRLKTVKV